MNVNANKEVCLYLHANLHVNELKDIELLYIFFTFFAEKKLPKLQKL